MGATKRSFKERVEQYGQEATTHKPAPGREEPNILFATRIPKHIVRALKVYVAQNDMTLRQFLTEAIEEAMKKKGIQ